MHGFFRPRRAGIPEPRLAHLRESAVRTPALLKWRALAVVSVTVGLAAFTAGQAEDPKQPVPKPAPADEATSGNRILLLREDGFAVLSPGGKKLLTGKLGPEDAGISWAWLSP